MVGSPRITRTLAAIFAVQLLQTASAEVAEEVCTPTSVKGVGDYEECEPSPKRGAELIQTAKRASLAGQGQSDAKQNHSDSARGRTTYCEENDDRWTEGKQSECWSKKPPSDTPDCTKDSGETPCRCKTAECRFDLLSSSPPTTARCAKKAVYFPGGTYMRESFRYSVRQVVGKGMETYCTEMVKTTDWHDKHLVKWPKDTSERSDSPKWNCWWNYMWKDGENGCFRKTRYLGEKCWDYGDCAGTKAGLAQCLEGTCVPVGFEPRKPCGCGPGTWKGALVCNSGSCNNRACLMSLEENKMYCDFDKSWYA